jgi:hypothetical protein
MNHLKSKVKKDDFKTDDKVKVNNMFFRNHGMKSMELIGTVRGIVPTWESKLPAIRVAFKFNPVFHQFSNNGYLKFNVAKENGQFVMLVRIHPMYIEKVK